MKKNLFILLLLSMSNILQGHAQTSPGSKPIKIKVDIHVHFNWHRHCEEGLGLCVDHLSLSPGRIVLTGITEINQQDFLYISRQGLTDGVIELFDNSSSFPVDEEVMLPAEYLRSEKTSGDIILKPGNYPIQKEEDYYLIPIKIEYQ